MASTSSPNTATRCPLPTRQPHRRSNHTMDTQPNVVAPLAPTANLPGPLTQRTARTSCPTPRDAQPQSHATSCESVCRHTRRHPTHARLPPKQPPMVHLLEHPTPYRSPPLPQHATQLQRRPHRDNTVSRPTSRRYMLQSRFSRRVPSSTSPYHYSCAHSQGPNRDFPQSLSSRRVQLSPDRR